MVNVTAIDTMKTCSKCNIEKPPSQYSKRSKSPDGLAYICKACANALHKQWYKENKPHHQAYAAARYRANRSSIRARHAEYYQNNKAAFARSGARRRAAKLERTPSWLTEDDWFIISETYELSQLRSQCTGVEHHVDHIIPLQGELVSGLHVPDNLQVIIGSDNISKSNSYDLERQAF